MMQFPKSSVFEVSLIEAVRNLPILYDRKAMGYNSKPDIDKAWENVFSLVSKKVKNVNVTHCKLRWRSLRDRYVKQFVKTKNGEIIEPDLSRWELNAQLDFLRPHLKKRKYGCERPPPTKRLRAPPTIFFKQEKQIPSEPENSTASFIEMHSSGINYCSDDSIIEEDRIDDTDFEGDQLQEIDESEVSEMEFVPFKNKREVSAECLPENIDEVITEVIVDPISHPYQCVDNEQGQKLHVSEDFTDQISELHQSFDATTHSNKFNISTDECINSLMRTVNHMLHIQKKKEAEISPNESYFKVLDGFFKKLPTHELDKAKVDILNLVMNRIKALERRHLM